MLLTGDKNMDIKILNELEDVDLVKICNMNRAADAICKDQNFWLNRIRTKFPYLSLDILNKYNPYTGDQKWSEYYIKDLIKALKNLGIYAMKGVEGRLDFFIITLKNWPYHNINLDELLETVSTNGKLDIVKYLVNEGADVNYNSNSSVKFAYKFNHLDVVDYLVSQGAPDPRV